MSFEFEQAMQAIEDEDINELEAIIDSNPSILTEKAKDSRSNLLQLAVSGKDNDCLAMVIKKAIKAGVLAENLLHKDEDGDTALHLSAIGGNPKSVSFLLLASGRAGLLDQVYLAQNYLGQTPLHLALNSLGTAKRDKKKQKIQQCSEVLELMLQFSPQATAKACRITDNDGDNPLDIAKDCQDFVIEQIRRNMDRFPPNTSQLPESKEFTAALKAIQNNDVASLRQLITTNPSVLDESTAMSNTSLMHAAAAHSANCALFLLQSLKKMGRLQEAYATIDTGGCTALHTAAMYGQRKTINLFLKFSPEDADIACRMVDNIGDYPLQLYSYLHKPDKEDRILKALEKHTLHYPFKEQSEPVTFSEIAKANPKSDFDKTIREDISNLLLVMNEVRSAIVASETHPSVRYKSVAEFKAIKKQLKELRKSGNKINTYSKAEADLIEEKGAGNCSEFATLFAHKMVALDPTAIVKIGCFSDKRGDHVWNEVIFSNGRAFFVDAWSGWCCPLDQRDKYLMDYNGHKKISSEFDHEMPVITFLNPRYHETNIEKTIIAQPKLSDAVDLYDTVSDDESRASPLPPLPKDEFDDDVVELPASSVTDIAENESDDLRESPVSSNSISPVSDETMSPTSPSPSTRDDPNTSVTDKIVKLGVFSRKRKLEPANNSEYVAEEKPLQKTQLPSISRR